MRTRKRLTNLAAALAAGALCGAQPQAAVPDFSRFAPTHQVRTVPSSIDDQDRVVLHGNVHPAIQAAKDFGPVNPALPMERMVLVMKVAPDAQRRMDELLAAQQDPGSPYYHQWLKPEEFGHMFGPSQDDVDAVAAWLLAKGFRIDEVSPGRTTINFSGNAAQVQLAFRTPIHAFTVDGIERYANAADPTIPTALAGLVGGMVSLHNIPRKAYNSGFRKLDEEEAARISGRRSDPDYTTGSTAYMAPNDFKTIYDVAPLYSAGTDGTGTAIAIVGRTNIALSDVTAFRSSMGLSANTPTVVLNGADPGDLGGGEETEADLDVEWSGAVGRGATVKFVVSKSTTTDGVDLSAQYIVNNASALGVSVISTSFGSCESGMGSSENTFYNNLWAQAATEGLTSFVSSGDAGASGCDGGGATTGTGRAVNGLSSTPYNVCVGGTEFSEGSSFSSYWGTTQSDYSSALKYIPEMAWNESGTVSGGSALWSSGGGVSTIYGKPSWQAGTGVPADGKRDCPDVSFTAASHDGYIIEQGGSLGVVGGTSAASPSWAGLMSLIVQKTGSAQGNPNTHLYALAAAQQAGTLATAVFHDVTSGNNSVPGVTGYSAGTGYDQVTGLGSVDANALVNIWDTTPPTGSFDVQKNGSSVSGQTTNGTITFTASATDGTGSGIQRVTLYIDGKFYKSIYSAPYTTTVDTTKLTNAKHTFLAYAMDNASNMAYLSPKYIYVTTSNADTTPPTGTASITGTSGTLTLTATAADGTGSGVQRVTFYIDGKFYKSIYAAPYTTTLNSITLVNGSHTFLAYAMDNAGNIGYLNHGTTFTVSN